MKSNDGARWDDAGRLLGEFSLFNVRLRRNDRSMVVFYCLQPVRKSPTLLNMYGMVVFLRAKGPLINKD